VLIVALQLPNANGVIFNILCNFWGNPPLKEAEGKAKKLQNSRTLCKEFHSSHRQCRTLVHPVPDFEEKYAHGEQAGLKKDRKAEPAETPSDVVVLIDESFIALQDFA
jgi:hypothetical protein